MKTKNNSLIFGALLLSLSAGCFENEESITVRVPYTLGAGMSCEEAQVTTIRASLGKNRSQQFEGPCDDSGELVMRNVREGKWSLLVEGLDKQGGVPLSSDIANPNLVLDFTEGDRITPMVTLTSVPAKVQVRWDLGFGDCDSYDLKGFRVQAWDESDARLLMTDIMDCDAPTDEQLYRTLDDPDGRIIGSQLRAVTIQAVSKGGQEFGEVMRIDLEEAPGRGAVLRASLKCEPESRACTLDSSEVVPRAQGEAE